jgi:two-component system cell cycle sensor histidine kinase PleC
MSHELRTPLNAIIGFSDVISRQMFGPVNGRYRSYVEDINQSGQHLLAVINDILDMSKVEAGKVELDESRVNAAGLIKACCHLVSEQAAAAGLALTSDVPPWLDLVIDEVRFKQVILNLLANSVKFTPRGGTVSVSASVAGDGAATVTVADTGIGMSADEIPRALAAFEQVENQSSRRYGGTGLGLPIARMLVVAHGGSLAIASAPGQGTRVILTLPVHRVVERGAGRDDATGLSGPAARNVSG